MASVPAEREGHAVPLEAASLVSLYPTRPADDASGPEVLRVDGQVDGRWFSLQRHDIAVAEDAGYFEATGRYVPTMLNLFQLQMEYQGPTADDPAVLGAISASVISGAGRAVPLTHPEALPDALTEFFSPAQQPDLTRRSTPACTCTAVSP